ncbi:MAG: isoprenylcysteine carboxylmethyltransferase family protein [Solirubrobacteraceae bacterium]
MPAAATIGALVALTLLLPVRILLQRRWTGSTGIVLGPHSAARRPGPGRTAVALLTVGSMLVGLGPALHWIGVEWAWSPADATLVHGVGFVLLVGGIGWAFWAQIVMRDAWRVGQRDDERLRLVTDGPFAQVRHPVYSGMVAIALGLLLVDPTVAGTIGAPVLAAGAIIQALRVEEPHLREIHGTTYWEWARHTGRFLPRVR